MYSLEVTYNRKTPNSVKLNALQNGYLGFLIFFGLLTPETQKSDLSKSITCKIKNFRYPENGTYVIRLHKNNRPTKFQSNIFIFGYAIAQLTVKVMTSLF